MWRKTRRPDTQEYGLKYPSKARAISQYGETGYRRGCYAKNMWHHRAGLPYSEVRKKERADECVDGKRHRTKHRILAQ